MNQTESEEQIKTCPHCGNTTPEKILMTASTHEPLYTNEDEPMGTYKEFYFLTRCKTCDDISLFSNWEYADDLFGEASVLYPKKREVVSDLPKAIRQSYEEAKRIEKMSPVAFAVMIRRALEYLCEDQQAKGRNLQAKVNDLASRGIIPGTLTEMADIVRLIGNIGAHASVIDIQSSEAEAIDDFFAAMLEYVYVAPAKIKKLKKAIQKKKKRPTKTKM